MTLPKFIICMDGTFRLGMVNQHKHLLKPGDQCIGGGYYHFDFVSLAQSWSFCSLPLHFFTLLVVLLTLTGRRCG